MNLDWSMMNQMIQALGWALVHFLWQGAIVGIVFAAGNAMLRRAAPAWRYGLGLVALATLAIAPIVTFIVSWEPVPAPMPESGLLALPMISIGAGAAATSGMDFASLLERGLPWVVGAWIFGVFAHSFRVYVNWRRMRRITRVGVRPVSSTILRQTAQLCELLGVRRMVQVLESKIVEVPTVLGWFKPVILLPTATLVGLTPRQIELVIAHELSHVRRWDYLVNLFQVSVETALFYHPVVGWISRRVREEREKCCDDLVVSHCGNHLEYAKALHNLESIRSGDLTPALAATDGKLFERIERIVSHRGAEPREAVAGNTLFLVFLGIVVVIAGRLADPMVNLELRRTVLADTLVQEMLLATVPRHTQALMAPLENARRRPDDAPATSSLNTAEPAVAEPSPARAPVARQATPPPAAATSRSSSSDAMELARAPVEAPVARARRDAMPPPPVVSDAERIRLDQIEIAAARLDEPLAAPRPQVLPPVPRGPVAIERHAPEYPVRARMAGQTGFVELSFAIGADGMPVDIEIDAAHPRRVFEKSSIRALRKWRFDRTTLGSGIERVTQRFDFNLAGGAPLAGADDRECQPITGTRICRSDSPTFLKAREAASN